MSSEFLNALKEGSSLQEYQIVRVLGAGGFGLTYLAFDKNLDKPMAIKEYLPNDLAIRHGEASVMPKAPDVRDDFKWGLEQFLNEARTLAKFNHPNIIRINRFFEANGTGYIVMDYAEGQTLTEKIKEQGTLAEAEMKPLLLAISEGLKQAHGFGILHRDIKPGNIMLLDDGTPILIDFGSARQAIGIKSKSVTSIVTPGYAPIEQYDSNGKQGPWTDIYALGAVAYVGLSGERPPDATGRIRRDTMLPAIEAGKANASKAFLEAIDWALAPSEESRPQDIDSWVGALSGGEIIKPRVTALDDDKTVIIKPSSKAAKRKKPTKEKQKNQQWQGDTPTGGKRIIPPDSSGGTGKWITGIVAVAVLVLSFSYGTNWFSDELVVEGDGASGVADNSTEQIANTATETDDSQIDTIAIEDPNELSEQEAWNRALAVNTIESFLDYLVGFPAGAHIADADIHLARLSEHNGLEENLYAASNVNVRRWPSTSASSGTVLRESQQVTIKGKVLSRDWYRLELEGNEMGFVHSSLLSAAVDDIQEVSLTADEQERQEIRQRWEDAIQQHGRPRRSALRRGRHTP